VIVAVARERPAKAKASAQAPVRWHMYSVALAARLDPKPHKHRACIVVQPTPFGAAGLRSTVVLPLTSKVTAGNAFPLRVRVPAGVCGLPRDRDVLIDQVSALDNRSFRHDLGELPDALRRQIRRALAEFHHPC